MPFLRLSKKHSQSTPKDDRALFYATTQSPSTPSIAPSTTTNASYIAHQQQQPYQDTTSTTQAFPNTHQQQQQPYQDTTQLPFSPVDDNRSPSSSSNSEDNNNDNNTPNEPEKATPPAARPQTPLQGSNLNPWTSYHNLAPDHPVFRYPDEVRERMYAKGIDPVVKAEMDLARLGKVYGESNRAKGFWKRGTSMMGQFGTMATGGAF